MSFAPRTMRAWQLQERWWIASPLSVAIETLIRASRVQLRVEGEIPREPVLFAMNSTHALDFLLLRRTTRRRSVRVLSIAKAKYMHQRLPRLVFQHGRVLPIGSRGYIIARDGHALLDRPLEREEYTELRDAVDRGDEKVPALFRSSRDLVGWGHDPARLGYAQAVRMTYEDMMRGTVELAARALEEQCSLHIYPEGTVRSRLGPGRSGAVQLALALSLPIVPVGLSNAGAVFRPGARGQTFLRFGRPIRLDEVDGFRPFEDAVEKLHRARLADMTTQLMQSISDLLEPPWRHRVAAEQRTHPERFFTP